MLYVATSGSLGSSNGAILGTYVDSTEQLYLIDGATNKVFRVDASSRTSSEKQRRTVS